MPSAEDGSLRIRGRNILDLRLDDGQTVREYLASLLTGLLNQPGTGDSLTAVIRNELASHGMIEDGDIERGRQLISEAIDVLAAEPFRPIGTKTDTERRLAQLQRRHSGSRR